MRALIDTNIFLDVALARPGAARSGELLDRLEGIPGSAFLAWHTLSNLYYVLAKASSPAAARSFLADVLAWADVAPVGQPEAKLALKLPQKDFEDCLQIASAEAAGATCIITRNKPDFRGSPIPALTPEEWLKQNA